MQNAARPQKRGACDPPGFSEVAQWPARIALSGGQVDSPTKPPFGVTSAEVVINCPAQIYTLCLGAIPGPLNSGVCEGFLVRGPFIQMNSDYYFTGIVSGGYPQCHIQQKKNLKKINSSNTLIFTAMKEFPFIFQGVKGCYC